MSLGLIGNNIPKHWKSPFLVDLVTPKQWKTIPTKNLIEKGYVVYGANGKIGFYSEYTHEKPTLMITCRGATCGNLHISEPCSYINGNAMALDSQPTDLVSLEFLFYALKARGLEDTISGSAQPQITGKGLQEVGVPLPPLAEQKVIAEKLDTLLAQVEMTKTRLESTLETLKQFRQSVLAAAVSGKLTDIDDFKAESFDKLIEEMRNGLSPKPNDDGLGYPILRISSVRSLEIDTSDIRYLECDELIRERYALKADDLLFTRYNGSLDFVGVCGLFKGCKYETLLYPDKLIRVRTNTSKLLPQYAEIYFSSPDVRSLVTNFVKSTSGQKGISGKDLKSVVVKYPTIVEQKRVIGMVEKLFTGADATEQQVNQALERVNNLTQSILAKAFRGELTEQWRKENPELISGDNSAEALLKKIKAERAAAKPKRKARTTSA
ncbi:restriction endonuclease subunit S [Vibrio vulnificus]|uniref:restriction endonuclease subunit S n=1 Tax=Vibrio vulnificus TaxID=672 RepID=UPI001CDCC469|nr:restriction endonuclease subunit S [Vibrio vulnificus]MCA3927852.1 restriction endonuclease subunit S [Vibrio vulnificus]